ncbi:FecR family protein [Sinomicrobium weinanense]|uniref:FecR domain-containing protein n=1 Tax=Sinomicrobium weinanense TaxID=2842200 RepID=A0A926JQH8_9FLAO|nr:FecR domain-containing protein [Sinomicrobium weinanense]MBC9795617.1 FecR domain-containing protein [Sinomicrobium weinanense]MBU3124638.1 FecR domain-containing protein [Sinomicrobium weinanense]
MKNDNLLAKWLSGEISEEELKILKRSEDLSLYEKIIAHADKLEAPAFDRATLLQKIQQQQSASSSKVVPLRPWKWMAGVAAVAAVILVSFLFLGNGDTVISTANAEKTDVVLPDKSEVTLNASSSLTYNEKKWNKKRLVKLDGEGFFKVAEGNAFDVQASLGTVSVLGTQFNVKNRKDYFEVSCYEGSIQVVYQKDTTRLAPGNTFRALGGEVVQTGGFADNVPSWIRNESSFKSVPYREVLKEFERQYNVKIRTDTETNRHFTGSFSNRDIETALKSITLPFRLKYEFTDGKKDEIIIYADKD